MRVAFKPKKQAAYTLSLMIAASASFMPGFAQDQTLPLGEVIRQDGGTVRGDRQLLHRAENRLRQAEQQSQDYIQSTQQWMQQNDAQIQANRDKLNALEAGFKSRAAMNKALNTPGSELYIVNTLLERELENKQQAEANIQTAQASVQERLSTVQQDRYQITSDTALMAHNQGTYRDEMDRYYDLVRQKRNARYMGNPMARHYLTGFDQAAYDAGRHPTGLGNPYWGKRANGAGYQGN